MQSRIITSDKMFTNTQKTSVELKYTALHNDTEIKRGSKGVHKGIRTNKAQSYLNFFTKLIKQEY